MKLGLTIGYSGARLRLDVPLVQEAEHLGYHAVWSAEAYGSDAVVPLAWLGALTSRIRLGTAAMQMPARTPANTAMTAMTLDQLSGGRFLLGLGASGPQVVEGWHGVAYGKPVTRAREYIAVLRQIFARREPLVHRGEHYRIPYDGPGATGLGKPLKSILHGRADLPIFLGATGPRNVALAAEAADGWLPIFFSPQHFAQFEPHLQEGFRRAGGKGYDAFEVAPVVNVRMGPDVQACRDALKPHLALYIGGMGSRGRNFYNDLCRRYGFEDAATAIQDAYLDGRRAEAAAAVPDALVDAVALCGPRERIAERLALWREAPVSLLNVAAPDRDTLRALAELVL